MIKEFEMEDYISIYQLNMKEMAYDHPDEDTKEKLLKLSCGENDKIYVAEKENKVVGYIHVNNYDTIYTPHMKNIMGIVVSKDYKRQGIGSMLIKEVEKWAKDTGAKGVRLVSGATRKEAHAFYHHLGYGNDKQQLNLNKMFEK